MLTTSPICFASLLGPITWICDKLRALPFFRRLALCLLQKQWNIVAWRSAVREVGSWNALQQDYGARLPILMYHGVGPLRKGADPFLNIPLKMFDNQMRWLSRKGFTPIHLADWIAYQREGKPLPPKPILLTFDDAYRDTAEFGFPVLQKYGFKGTLFVVTNHIGGTNEWDLPLGFSEQPLMRAEEIRYWAANGIEIGSHSQSHPDLREITADEIFDEMKKSREHLEQLIGAPVNIFSYPYGYIDSRATDAARIQYAAAVSCKLGINVLSTDPVVLRRATIVPFYTLGQMFWSTHFGYNFLLTARIQLGPHLKPLVRFLGLRR
jgi:peptidoglycan/xylan/chitin deacetylase (PgdA/CDA1 family)